MVAIATFRTFPAVLGKTPRLYYIGVHDTPSPFSLNLLFYTTHFTICLEVRWTSLKSMIHPKLFLRKDMKECLADTYNRKQLHFE